MATSAILECSGLRRMFGERSAVADVGFSIGPGEVYGLLGPNGAGKTTTISMICGLLRRDGGRVVVDGHDMDTSPRSVRAAIGYVPQELAIYPDLTAAENLVFFGRLQGMRNPELSERAAEVVETIGLVDRADDRTEDFSGGMKRRLNIGIGLLHRPRLLILDEPTVGVDPQSRDAILAGVERLGASGIGVLYTTHYMEEAERLCDRVGIIDQGRLIAEGTRRELVTSIGAGDRVRLSVAGHDPNGLEQLRRVDGVESLSATDHSVELALDSAHRALPAIIRAANDGGIRVTSVELIEPDLEAVFLHLTGRALRD